MYTVSASRDRINPFKLMTAATGDILSSTIFTNFILSLVRWTCSASDGETLERAVLWQFHLALGNAEIP